MKTLFFLILSISTLIGAEELDVQYGPENQKIVFVSIPKSGTHLLRKAIRLLTKEAPIRWIAINNVWRFDPYQDLKMPMPITGAHLFPELDLIRTECPDMYKKILLIRDPRDLMVSFMFHLQNQKIWAGKDNFDFEKFTKLPQEQKLSETLLYPDTLRNPKTCFPYVTKWMQDPDVLVCRFEDLVGPKGGGSSERQIETLKKLASFLGVSKTDKEIKQLAKNLFGGTWTFRKGKIGSWKKYYNQQNKELFKQLMGQSVIDFGYAKDDQW